MEGSGALAFGADVAFFGLPDFTRLVFSLKKRYYTPLSTTDGTHLHGIQAVWLEVIFFFFKEGEEEEKERVEGQRMCALFILA